MVKGINTITLTYPRIQFEELKGLKEKKNLTWEDFFLLAVENLDIK